MRQRLLSTPRTGGHGPGRERSAPFLVGLGTGLALALLVAGCGGGGSSGPPFGDLDAGGPPELCKVSGAAPASYHAGDRHARQQGEVDGQGNIVAPAGTCDRADFFIEASEGAATPCEGFQGDLERRLTDWARENLCNIMGDSVQGDAASVPAALLCEPDCSDGTKRLLPSPHFDFMPQLEPVFDRRPEHPDGAERRFFRLRFLAMPTELAGVDLAPIHLAIPDATLCDVLSSLQTLSTAALTGCGAPADDAWTCDEPVEPLRIGRECRMMDAGFEATAGMKNWHLDRLGVVPGAPGPQIDPAARPVVALLDTGITPGFGYPTLLPNGSSDTFANTVAPHPHGSLMTALLASVDPAVDLVSIRALDTDGATRGLGTTAELARAIDLATFGLGRDPSAPVLMNLSLGWPEELSRPRIVRGIRRGVDGATGRWGHKGADGACSVTEDGAGEVVRYALAMARHAAEHARRAPVVAFAAAGNRSESLRDSDKHLNASIGRVDCAGAADPRDPGEKRAHDAWCKTDAPVQVPGGGLFLPAMWGHVGSRQDPWAPHACDTPERLLIPVAALDDRDRPAVNDRSFLQPPLVAPGEHVYADDPRLTVGKIDVLGPCDPPPARPPATPARQPMALSGTSVSAALVTGLSAALTENLVARHLAPFDVPTMARYLYVTGLTTRGAVSLNGGAALQARPSLDGPSTRRPNLCRALKLLDTACGTEAALACLRTGEGPEWFHGTELATCGATFDTCLRAVDSRCPSPTILPEQVPASYPPAAPRASDSCIAGQMAPNAVSRYSATGSKASLGRDERPEYRIDVHAAAALGPQPTLPACPDCLLTYTSTTASLKLVVDINPSWPPSGTLSNPKLVIYDTRYLSGLTASQTVDLYGTTVTYVPNVLISGWKAGTRLTITAPAPVGSGRITASPTDWKLYIKAELRMNAGTGTTAPVDVSPLRVQVN